ncbi:molybdopterin molybdotransferase MoeA [Reichenbachiella agarivorans]|uniref:Molybdopterin molybdenumtransferase n=1 Tax=Reichenbachiella agarivorans TaxID=2979464 RepID=A0ABY6CPM0_9BACT|nr:molybdopterin molybdotransferase MoeA [Reichenbachiella agarivorans]UXP32463.1 molybdopterin molybdotransferase MoeA [Reichenbachiella agarivorans]
MISVEEARKFIDEHHASWGSERVSLGESLGRVLAEEVRADRDFPPFDRVTMDGVAIGYEAYVSGRREFEVSGVQYAGEAAKNISGDDQCLEVMTGAVLGSSCDMVIRYEDVVFHDQDGRRFATISDEQGFRWKNVHRQGSDQKEGEVLLAPGQVIHAGVLAILATVGRMETYVQKFPKVAIVSTGDELVDVAQIPKAYQIRKSNVVMMESVLTMKGVSCSMFHLLDDYEILTKELSHILKSHDVLLLSGGVSKGKADFLPQVLEELGVEKQFHTVAQRPGKPFWFGIHQKKPVFAFPGNPISTMMCFQVYFMPWLSKQLHTYSDTSVAVLTEDVVFKPDLGYFVQVSLQSHQGRLYAMPQAGNGSGDLVNLAKSTGFLYLPAGQEVYKKNKEYLVYSFSPL